MAVSRSAALASLLLACAACSRPADDARRVFDYYYLEPYRPRFAREGAVYASRPTMGRARQTFAARKAPGTKRVFLIGGSVAQLWDSRGEPTLRRALEASRPGERVEVVNCGSSGYESGRDLLALEEVLAHQPDLVVVLSGVNETGEGLPGRALARACARAEGLPGAGALCRRLILAAVARGGRPAAEAFEANVRSMARLARSRGVPLVLATMPVNLSGMPPKGVLPLGDPRFFAAWRELERGRWAAAAEALRAYLRDPAASAFGEYHLARSLERLGRRAEARRRYEAAWDRGGGAPVPTLNEALRRIAREEGAALADLERAFAEASPGGIAGGDLFEDDVHWDRGADALASLSVASALAAARPGDWSGAWAERSRPSVLAAARAVRADARRSWMVFRYRAWEPANLADQVFSERELALLETIRRAHPALLAGSAGLRDWVEEQLADNVWGDSASRLDAWWPAFLAHVGELYRRRGEWARSAAYFEAALAARPDLPKARLHLALARLGGGRRDLARLELARIPDPWSDPETALRMRAHGLTPAAAAPPAAPSAPVPAAEALVAEARALIAPEDPARSLARRARLQAALLEAFAAGGGGGMRAEAARWPPLAGSVPEALDRCLVLERVSLDEEAERQCGGVVAARPAGDALLTALCARAQARARLNKLSEARADWAAALAAAPAGWSREAEVRAALESSPGRP